MNKLCQNMPNFTFEKGVNKTWHKDYPGESFIGMHLRFMRKNNKWEPLEPLTLQAAKKLIELRALKKPKLP